LTGRADREKVARQRIEGGAVYARIASFEGGDFERLRQMTTQRIGSGSASELPEGTRRVLVLADASRTRRLFITLFDSREATKAAEERFEQMGDEIPEDVRGRRTSVESFEVTIDEGGEGAAAARVSRTEGSPEQVDDVTAFARDNVLERLRALDGWKGFLALADRDTGRACLISFWESTEALEASEERADDLRRDSAEASGGTIVGVERYEVVFSHTP
jgi:heme-degrading monooxygenase HmoA